MKRSLAVLLTVFLMVFCLASSALCDEVETATKSEAISAETQVTVATAAITEAAAGKEKAAFLSKWLHMLDSSSGGGQEKSSVLAYGTQVPGDLLKIILSIGGSKGGWGVIIVGLLTGLSFLLGLGAVFLSKKMLQDRIQQLQQLEFSEEGEGAKVTIALLRSLPSFVAVLIFAIVATLFFLMVAGSVSSQGRMLFQFLLGVLIIYQACRILSEIIFSPKDQKLRFFTVQESLLGPLHFVFSVSSSLLGSSLLFMKFFRELGAHAHTISWLAMFLGSLVLGIFAYLIVYLRTPITKALREEHKGNSLKEQLAAYWHLPALFYLLVVWFIWIGQESTGAGVRNGAFVISVMAVPIYFVFSHFGKLVIYSVIDSLNLFSTDEYEEDKEIDTEEIERVKQEKVAELSAKVFRFFKLFLGVALATWILSLWGYKMPFAAVVMKAIFESLVVIGLALLCWRGASAFIERKIEEATPEEEEKQEDTDDEFGGAVPRGRSHTLLPMLRKVLGTVLVVMVILIVISSFGVNIGPLLAGAGVFGLAIGFGAQKLVSDVLSGFFFLLDDAFRVGEYIQAGNTRGTVESITLRNVLLRHHLGMLQVVPHSDLGAITNYMRGGIVIKFPLEFPYDTDIDKVRKIIKKVGQAMLQDEELGDDFILPVKSQGVYEITNSVMVIRVKFTSKPGKQFVIKREAFRRITEALNNKGIYYAHRKVIVDFPQDTPQPALDEAAKKKVLEAGAAAALTAEAQAASQEKKES